MLKKIGKCLDLSMFVITPTLGIWAAYELWPISIGLSVSCAGWALIATDHWYREFKN